MQLGKLQEIDIRSVWAHEQYDFSAWLAQEENIQELGNTLNLSLTDVETEKFVGSYRCDIICKDEITGKSVLIENQLETTNHDHLGKLITYASGLDASVVIWIVPHARQEFASAIEWLNKHTTKDIDFFLIEVHVYRIGNSEAAPMFTIVEQPNDFARTVKELASSGALSDAQTYRLEFWNKFNDAIDACGKPFGKHKATSDHWYTVAIGSSKCHLSIDLVNKEHFVRVSLWISDCKELFDSLLEKREQIEQAIGKTLSWNRLDGKKAAYIATSIAGLDFENQSNYDELMKQIIETVSTMKTALTPFLK